MNFQFELKQSASISASGETGLVIGRADYATSENSYLLRYRGADGRAVEAWWGESALVPNECRVVNVSIEGGAFSVDPPRASQPGAPA